VNQVDGPARPGKPDVVIVTGMSGAGRSTAADVLEDLGWFVVDNLPPALLPTLLDLDGSSQNAPDRIGVVADVRSRQFFTHLNAALQELASRGIDPRVVFLEASDEALVRRFESVRRPHPLQGAGRVLDGIAAEREYLRDLRADADLVIDTSVLNVHQLAAKLISAFSDDDQPTVRATLVSFGYKYGIPVDADLVVDCRFLPNPHWVPELRPQTGLDPDVSDYVLTQKGAVEFLDRYRDVLELVAEGFVREGKRYVTVAVGCTGGKHRSVAMAEALAGRLRDGGMQTLVVHRDLGRE
jgi:RNase adapter protein RapZ